MVLRLGVKLMQLLLDEEAQATAWLNTLYFFCRKALRYREESTE
jgi:hypothetical protein